MGYVYLSKSGQADYDDVLKLRSLLRHKGYEIREHTGGEYDPSIPVHADIVIVVPPSPVEIVMTLEKGKKSLAVGKGNGDEINHHGKGLIYIEGKLYEKISQIQSSKADWQRKYWWLRFKPNDPIELPEADAFVDQLHAIKLSKKDDPIDDFMS